MSPESESPPLSGTPSTSKQGRLIRLFKRRRLQDHLIALALAVATLVTLMNTADMGFTRDEGFYFRAAHDYIGWFDELDENLEAGTTEDSFTQENIDKHWEFNKEHPVMMKSLFALSHRSFARERDWLSPSLAMRFPTMLFSALLIWGMFLFASEVFGRTAGLFACLAYISMPRVFFHMHLACFDAVMNTMWFFVLWFYWKSLRSRRWAWATGIAWGLALITKLNAFFIPGVLIIHWLWTGWASTRLERRGEKRALMLQLPQLPFAFTPMATLGPFIFYMLWPRHWFESFSRIFWYIDRHLSHEHYAVQYFDELLVRPPFSFSFPFVMSWFTIPLITIVAFAVGCAALTLETPLRPRLRFLIKRLRFALPRRFGGGVAGEPSPTQDFRRDERGTLALMFLGGVIPFLIIARSSTPIFGGVKHWMTAMPFFAIIAGVGFSWALRGALRPVRDAIQRASLPIPRSLLLGGVNLLSLALIPLILWPSVRATAHSHPFGTSYYNGLMGGYIGAAKEGMHRQFWGYASREAVEWINDHADERAAVHFHNMILYAYRMYKEDGLLRKDIRFSTNLSHSQYVLYHHQRAFHSFQGEIWDTYRTKSPVYVVSVDGVPLLSIYENPDWKKIKKKQTKKK